MQKSYNNNTKSIIIKKMIRAQGNSSDSIDPQFLTFRHNSPQTVLSSGRTIYSQRLDYKSLQKYPMFDGSNSQRYDMEERSHKKTKQVIKQKHLRSVKSQQKYKQLFSSNPYNAEDNFDQNNQSEQLFINSTITRDETKTTKQDPKHRRSGYNDKQQILVKTTNSQQLVEKNTQLKLKLNKLVKNMKKEQRKQYIDEQSINQLSNDIEEYNREIQDQTVSMNQLKQICQQNMKQCNRIRQSIHKVSKRNQEIASNLENLEESVDSSEISIQTSKQDEVKDRLFCTKLKEGMTDLTKLKSATELRLARLQQQIQNLQYQIQQMKSQENDILKIFGFSLEHKNQSLSQNQSHSHNSSNGSNRESLYYY